VLYFMGRRRGARTDDHIQIDRRRGPDGVRVTCWFNDNSIKFYDKGSVLRAEVPINEPKDFRVWRASQTQRSGPKRWRILRRSVADMYRRVQVSQAGTQRLLSALAAVHHTTPLALEAAWVCEPIRRNARRHRALNPFGSADAQLLSIVHRAEYTLNGFRHRDVRTRLHGLTPDSVQRGRQMAAVGRRLALLRAHGLIRNVSHTHRYVVTDKGRRIITALLAARQANIDQLTALAA